MLNQNDGVIAYVSNKLNSSAYEPIATEGNFLVLKIDTNITVVCTYRPPCFQNPSKYVTNLHDILNDISTDTTILTGDINLDIMPDSIKGSTSDYLNMLASLGFTQCIDKPTRKSACLDHFMVKGIKHKIKSAVFGELTDHSPILLYINKIKINKTNEEYVKTILDYDSITKSLKNMTWDQYYLIKNANDAATTLVNILHELIDSNSKTIKITKRNKPIKPWITSGVIKSIRKRDRLHKLLKSSPDEDEEEAIRKYKIYRNICNNIIKNLKTKYFEQKLKTHAKDTKETWKTIKEICEIKQQNSTNIDLLTIDDTPKTSLDKVNCFFTEVGKMLASKTLNKLGKTETTLAREAKKESPLQSLSLFLTHPEEIRILIMKLKISTSPGSDNITSGFLKRYSQFLCEPIAHLINISLETGVFPAIFKESIIIPIHKTGDKSCPTNYRPISLLSTLSKVTEKVVNKRLIAYLENNNMLSSNQYGFRENRSTSDAVLLLTDKITKYLDMGEKCLGVFLDLQKAFDTVSVEVLLTKLENVGVRGVAWLWFRDYLTNRKQRVRVGSVYSDPASAVYGIPQGSTLAPTLFLIYINDLCERRLHKADLLMFADDTVILFHECSWDILKKTVETELISVTTWLNNNLLTLNVSKTKYVPFYKTARSKFPRDLTISLHESSCSRDLTSYQECTCPKIEKASTLKYLGVTLDENLSWKKHVSGVASRIRSLIFIFRKLRNAADLNLLLNTYIALCQCLVNYCICAWGGASKNCLIEAERAQRAVLKVILNVPFKFPTQELYLITKMLSIRKTYIFESIKHLHKNSNSMPITQSKRANKFNLPVVKSAIALRQFNFLAPYLYNIVDKKFKIRCKKIYYVKKITKKWLENLNYNDCEQLFLHNT